MIKPFLKYHIKDRWVLWQQTQQLKNLKQEPVLVFTMAKVGSSSVYHSLKKQSDIPCFHIHSLSIEEEEQAKAICKEKGVYPGSRSPVFILHKYLLEKERRYKVISLVRNPIERNLSAFFEAFEIHMGVPAHHFKGSLQDIEKAFYEKLDHSYCKDWFDNHLKDGIGVDVYAYAFAKAKGYTMIKGNQTDILLLKTTLDDTLKSKLIGDFCGVENFTLENYNVTDAKKGATLYADFKSYIRFPKSYLESQLESKYMNHFFTEEEKEMLYEKWLAV
ncbi:putative capsular polysaccharide synthesis family protein [uncultured Dokdonia sp.]|uniref:putative capsular polysaccharide synthesis family protein n=1 Tax=uncultured Dokdonia sp. TaxID=575653 RepID=UPI002610F50D|nr:putative capsular polysaccharide synthesis family protein [uncultured Dokdonia sp.]